MRGNEKMNFLWVEDFPLFLPKEEGSGKCPLDFLGNISSFLNFGLWKRSICHNILFRQKE